MFIGTKQQGETTLFQGNHSLSLTLIDGHRAHYGHRHNTRSDVNVISQLFVWWSNAVPLKGITWLLECMEPWWWVTWLVRWSSAAGFSHDQHTYTITAALKWGKVRGRVAWESMMCLFTFSAGWVNLRSWGFLRIPGGQGSSVWIYLWWNNDAKIMIVLKQVPLNTPTCLLLVELTGSSAPCSHHWFNQFYYVRLVVIYEKMA